MTSCCGAESTTSNAPGSTSAKCTTLTCQTPGLPIRERKTGNDASWLKQQMSVLAPQISVWSLMLGGLTTHQEIQHQSCSRRLPSRLGVQGEEAFRREGQEDALHLALRPGRDALHLALRPGRRRPRLCLALRPGRRRPGFQCGRTDRRPLRHRPAVRSNLPPGAKLRTTP